MTVHCSTDLNALIRVLKLSTQQALTKRTEMMLSSYALARVMKQPTQHQTERTEIMLSSYGLMRALKQPTQQILTERTNMMLSSYVPVRTLKPSYTTLREQQ